MTIFMYQFINNSAKLPGVLLILKRFKSKKKLKLEERTPCEAALKHFDDFYKAVFKEKWPSVRLGLLSKPKYFAIINNFGDVEKTEKLLQSKGAFDVRSFLEVQKNYTQHSSAENSVGENEIGLDKIILDHLQEEKEKESHLHPQGIEFEAKDDDFSEKTDLNYNRGNDIDNEDGIYNYEDDWSSLDSNLKKAEIDTSRIIMPDSEGESSSLHEYIPVTQLRGVDGYIPESDYYKYYKVQSNNSVRTEEEHELDFPENLKVYTFDRGDVTDFPEPTRTLNNVFNFLILDGADVLAALALGVRPSDTVLDLCSTSGNIAFCILQMLRAKYIVCTNDRCDGTKKLFNQYLYDGLDSWSELLLVTSTPIDEVQNDGLFDKVLIDVPSTFDKKSLFEAENNPFHVMEKKNRLRMPELQCSLLVKGLRLTRPGGTALYTTSTLSPIQNEGVVFEALRTVWNEDKMECTVINLVPALKHTFFFFNFGDYLNLKFGTLVVPFVPVNFGPRYICKIIRNENKREKNTTSEIENKETYFLAH